MFDETVAAHQLDRQTHDQLFAEVEQLGPVPPLLWNDGQSWIAERNSRLCITVGDAECVAIIAQYEGAGASDTLRPRTERTGLDPNGPATENDPDYLDWKDSTLALLDLQAGRQQSSGTEWNLIQDLYEATNDRLCDAFDERRCRAVFDSLGVKRGGETRRLTDELERLSEDPLAALDGVGITIPEWFEETTELLDSDMEVALTSIFFVSYNDNLCKNLGEYRCRQVFDTIGMPRDGFSES